MDSLKASILTRQGLLDVTFVNIFKFRCIFCSLILWAVSFNCEYRRLSWVTFTILIRFEGKGEFGEFQLSSLSIRLVVSKEVWVTERIFTFLFFFKDQETGVLTLTGLTSCSTEVFWERIVILTNLIKESVYTRLGGGGWFLILLISESSIEWAEII